MAMPVKSALVVLFALVGCDDMGQSQTRDRMAEAAAKDAASAPAPNPDLPMNGAKARQIMDGLPLACVSMASLKMDQLTCAERTGQAANHDALRTELRELRQTLYALPADQATARCSAIDAEMQRQPKPQACWDLGNG